MSTCKLDHSREDVLSKLNSQEAFLPELQFEKVTTYLKGDHPQETLNELFHLLKKYDLISKTEQEERNEKLILLTK